MYLLAINQALPYGCSFVTYGHPEDSAAGCHLPSFGMICSISQLTGYHLPSFGMMCSISQLTSAHPFI